jgi:hypothetical protein
MYSCVKVANYSKNARGEIKEKDGEGASRIHCKHFYKCHNVPQYNNMIRKK